MPNHATVHNTPCQVIAVTLHSMHSIHTAHSTRMLGILQATAVIVKQQETIDRLQHDMAERLEDQRYSTLPTTGPAANPIVLVKMPDATNHLPGAPLGQQLYILQKQNEVQHTHHPPPTTPVRPCVRAVQQGCVRAWK